jgi:hypothetical protein
MKVFKALKAGIMRSVRSWKALLIIWALSLLLVCLVAVPMKNALNTGFGNSSITEKLASGIDIEVFADLGAAFTNIISYFAGGLFMLFITAFLLNSFLSGGLFSLLRADPVSFSTAEFFRISAKKFRAYFAISFIISMFILFLGIVIIIIPLSVIIHSEAFTDGIAFRAGVILSSFFILTLIITIIAADYSRAWLASGDKTGCLSALRFGIRQTFRTFYSCYPMMVILLAFQVLYVWLVLKILGGMKPVTVSGIFFLFIFSQLLFYIKILLKAWRYGSITKLMEQPATLSSS